MDNGKIRMLLEEQGLKQDKIDEFMSSFGSMKNEERVSRENDAANNMALHEEQLRLALINEKDPIKKAQISARIISINL